MDRSFVLEKLEKLEKKKELDPECLGFGAKNHGYDLLPPIGKVELEKLEKKYGVSFPSDYRNFILEIGNGGAGPSYGLYSVESALTGEPDKTYSHPGSDVGEEIKHAFIRPDEAEESAQEHLDECGMLTLCQHGCANDDFLIVNGGERGFVWEYIEWVGHLVPLLKSMPELTSINELPQNERQDAENKWVNELLAASNNQKMTFLDWYTEWLEKPPHIPPGEKERQVKAKRKSWFKKR